MPLKAIPKMYEIPFSNFKPEGWLKHQIDLTISGFFGHYHNISEFLTENNGWLRYKETSEEVKNDKKYTGRPIETFACSGISCI